MEVRWLSTTNVIKYKEVHVSMAIHENISHVHDKHHRLAWPALLMSVRFELKKKDICGHMWLKESKPIFGAIVRLEIYLLLCKNSFYFNNIL